MIMQGCISDKAARARSREAVRTTGINFRLVANAIYWRTNVLQLYSTLKANVGEDPPRVTDEEIISTRLILGAPRGWGGVPTPLFALRGARITPPFLPLD
jgi:hypothetical protein